MDGKIDIYTLVILILAVVVILKLRSVLGRKSEDDDARVERYKAQERARAAAQQAQDKVVALPVKDPYHIMRNVILILELLYRQAQKI